MAILESLLIVFIPTLLGYALPWRDPRWHSISHRATGVLLYAILGVIGASLAQREDFLQQLPNIGRYALIFTLCTQAANIAGMTLFDRLVTKSNAKMHAHPPLAFGQTLYASLKLILAVVIGMALGFVSRAHYPLPLESSTLVLIGLLFFVGMQLRLSAIPLRKVLLDGRGVVLSLLFMLTTFLGGIVGALWLDLPLAQGLALVSGFGWYSLSSVMVTDSLGAVWGSVVFLNDLSRELLCLFSIPMLMARFPGTAISLSGATAMDCSLPIIQRAGGSEWVPLAMSFGVIINLVVPFLLALFLGMLG